jgi:hypothetical protein
MPRRLRNLQHLARLDLVRIAQLIWVGVEDVHVGVRIAKHFLGDLAERVTGQDRGGALGGAGCKRAPSVALISATISFGHSGIVLIASQILLASACVPTVPWKYSFPSRSSAAPCILKSFAV